MHIDVAAKAEPPPPPAPPLPTRRLAPEIASRWATRPPAAPDVEAIEAHQLGHRTQTIGVPAASRCRRGFPQATLQDPSVHKFGAGLVRLTCPHLCEAIDAWERDDAVRTVSKALLVDGADASKHRDSLDRVNARHAATRRSLVEGTDAERRAVERLGEDAFSHAMGSGIAGISQGKLEDVKCLHAQVADELLSGDNALGKAILDGLGARGVDVAGSPTCHEQCSGCDGGWRYTPTKNKQKLWTTKRRHKELQELRKRGVTTSLGPGLAVEGDA